MGSGLKRRREQTAESERAEKERKSRERDKERERICLYRNNCGKGFISKNRMNNLLSCKLKNETSTQ